MGEGARVEAQERPTTLGVLRRLLVASVAAPMLALLGVGGVLYVADEVDAPRGDLEAAADVIARQIDACLETHCRAVVFAARAAAGEDPGDLRRLVDDLRESTSGFRTTFAADRSGRVVAASPDRAPDGTALAGSGASVADRAYFLAARDGRLHVSDALRGRGFGDDAIVAIAAPVIEDGAVTHVVEGSLDLARFGALADEEVVRGSAARVLIRDGDGRLVHDTGARLAPLTRTAADPDHAILSSTAVAGADWTVRTVLPLASVIGDAVPFLVAASLLVVLGVVSAVLLASAAARRLLRPLDQLAAGAERLQLAEELDLAIDARAPAEFAALGSTLEQTSRRLQRTLSGLIPICASCKRVRLEDEDWVQVEAYVRDRSDADFSHGICPECAERYE